MSKHPLVFNVYTATCFEDFYGKARLYELTFAEVTLDRLSDKGKLKALELGFSPAVEIGVFSKDWHPSDLYCPSCGSNMVCPLNDEGSRWICESCLTTWIWSEKPTSLAPEEEYE